MTERTTIQTGPSVPGILLVAGAFICLVLVWLAVVVVEGVQGWRNSLPR